MARDVVVTDESPKWILGERLGGDRWRCICRGSIHYYNPERHDRIVVERYVDAQIEHILALHKRVVRQPSYDNRYRIDAFRKYSFFEFMRSVRRSTTKFTLVDSVDDGIGLDDVEIADLKSTSIRILHMRSIFEKS